MGYCIMTSKPTYLGLLNRIANAEAEAECYLDAWAATTPRDDVRQIISTVALREGEHGKAFAKRMCELGYAVEPPLTSTAAQRMPITSSTTLTDREKFERLSPWKECGDCAYIPVCAGGCVAASYSQLGDMNIPTCHKRSFDSALVSLAHTAASAA